MHIIIFVCSGSGMSDVETSKATHSDSTRSTGLLSDPRPLEANRKRGSSAVDPQVMNIIANVERDKWLEIGRVLDFSYDELTEYEHSPIQLKEKLYKILYNWRC
jgi:hypothetical protein